MPEEQNRPPRIQRLPDSLEIRSSGLILPSGQLARPVQEQPRDLGVDETKFVMVNGVLMPKSKEKALEAAGEEEILKLAAKQTEKAQAEEAEKYPPLTTREVTLLLSNPRALLQQNFLQTCGVERGAELQHELREIVHVLQKFSFGEKSEDESIPQRQYQHLIVRKALRKVTAGQYRPTEPGPAEKMGLEFVRYFSHPELRKQYPDQLVSLVLILKNVLTELRGYPQPMRELPEMPELLMGLLRSAELSANQNLRFHIYDCVEQIKTPTSLHQVILEFMQEAKDVTHPLAYKLLVQLASTPNKEQNGFLQHHHEQRERLLEKLSASPQELFDNFRVLSDEANHLVTGLDMLDIPQGKIGMEVECVIRRQDEYAPPSVEWEAGKDRLSNEEVRRDSNYLELNAEYMVTLSELADWLRDRVITLAGFHIHLDTKKHPIQPDLHEMFRPHENEYVVHNDLNTWEVRGLFVPTDRVVTRLSPALIADAIATHISAANPNEINKAESLQKLSIQSATGITEKRLLWGALCRANSNPKIRLGLLKMIQHPYFLQGYHMEKVVDAYDSQYAAYVMDGMKKSQLLSSKHQQDLLQYAYAQGFKEYIEKQLKSENPSVAVYATTLLLAEKTEMNEQVKEETTQIYNETNHPFVKKAVVTFWCKDSVFFNDQLVRACALGGYSIQSQIAEAWFRRRLLFRKQIAKLLEYGGSVTRGEILGRIEETPTYFSKELKKLYDSRPGSIVSSTIVEIWFTDPLFFKRELTELFDDENLSSIFLNQTIYRYFANLEIFLDVIKKVYYSHKSSQVLKNNLLQKMASHPEVFANELEQLSLEKLDGLTKSRLLQNVWINDPKKHADKIMALAVDKEPGVCRQAVELIIHRGFEIFDDNEKLKKSLVELYEAVPYGAAAKHIHDFWQQHPDYFAEELRKYQHEFVLRSGDLRAPRPGRFEHDGE